MHSHRPAWLTAPLVLVTLAGAAPPADPVTDFALAQDEKLLREHKVKPDGPSLLVFFRERTLTEAEKARLAGLVRQLGDDSFDAREAATRSLLRAGRLAVPLLAAAQRDGDAEVARRAADCLR